MSVCPCLLDAIDAHRPCGRVAGLQAPGGLGAYGAGNDEEDEPECRALSLLMDYGFGVFGDRFTAMPEVGLEPSDGYQDYDWVDVTGVGCRWSSPWRAGGDLRRHYSPNGFIYLPGAVAVVTAGTAEDDRAPSPAPSSASVHSTWAGSNGGGRFRSGRAGESATAGC